MNKDKNNQVVLVIYGAGALGGACCVDRLENTQLGQVDQVILCNQTHLCHSVSFRSEDAQLANMQGTYAGEAFTSKQLDDFLRSSCLKKSLEVCITVPPQALDGAISFFLARADLVAQSFATASFNALSNGAISSNTLEGIKLLLQQQPQFAFYRSLVVAGFQKKVTAFSGGHCQLEVTHTSGRRVYWNRLCKSFAGKEHPFAGSLLFDAVQIEDIRKLELQKVFANLVLGFGIQDRLLPNAALKGILRREESLELAEEFSAICPESGSAEGLQEFLWRTVEETHSNINSVSRAWAQKDDSLACYFKTFVFGRCTREAPCTKLRGFMQCLF